MSGAWSAGSTYRWRKRRAAVLLANASQNRGRCTLNVGVRCQKHGRRCPGVCTGVADQVHHAEGKARGDGGLLVPCCRACNLHVGQPRVSTPAPIPRSNW